MDDERQGEQNGGVRPGEERDADGDSGDGGHSGVSGADATEVADGEEEVPQRRRSVGEEDGRGQERHR
ncbi:hypothetical protein ACFQMM_16240 [Saliphagus sp. GCM10025308]